tara:strand:+ start:1327 stop:2514 length:1188 start_codon:yes stop_codon:yes gene_type:complete
MSKSIVKFSVIGLGYVGLANALVLAKYYQVIGFDQDTKKIQILKNKKSYIKEEGILNALNSDNIDFNITNKKELSYANSDYVIIATPTNYDPEKDFFDTSSVEDCIRDALKFSPAHCLIIIKSTIPIGFVEKMRHTHETSRIVFCPEFLREGSSFEDAKNPSRIIIGSRDENSRKLGKILKDASAKNDTPIIYTGSKESEAIKLFSNTYLAMRVAFFNELDSFSIKNNLISKDIIDGISQDSRIGNFYNNPSFGYGGYCLPKDTKQLLSNFSDTPQNLISAIVKSNLTRRKYLAQKIIDLNPKKIGIYRVAMKANSDNYRSSSILELAEYIEENSDAKIIIYDPQISLTNFKKFKVLDDFKIFASSSDVILANRFDKQLKNLTVPIFTRDIYNEN